MFRSLQLKIRLRKARSGEDRSSPAIRHGTAHEEKSRARLHPRVCLSLVLRDVLRTERGNAPAIGASQTVLGYLPPDHSMSLARGTIDSATDEQRMLTCRFVFLSCSNRIK